MSSGERGERVALDRSESPKARSALRANEVVQRTIDDGGVDAIRMIMALFDAAPVDNRVVAVGSGPLEDLVNEHGDDLVGLVEQTARRTPEIAASHGSGRCGGGTLRPETADRLALWLPEP